MWIFYALSLLPLAAGAILWIRSGAVVWWEWGLSAIAGLLCAVIFHGIACAGMTADTETWSGRITQVCFYPRWVELEVVTETHTDSKGNSYTTTRYDYTTHYEHWTAYTDIDTDSDINRDTYEQFCRLFGNRVRTVWKLKSGFDHGDHNVYPCDNETNYLAPITAHKRFENRIMAAPTLFSFPPVPINSHVFDYPKNGNWFASDRLMGEAKAKIDIYGWDCMNARLGPAKKVNVILCGFPTGTTEQLGHYQQAKWVGGKKNDLVLCYGAATGHPGAEWAYVFGWTESEICKQNLQSLLLSNPIDNALLPKIEAEVNATYHKKDWHKFDYITIQPPGWSYAVFVVVMIVTQAGYWCWACNNDCDKDE